MATNNPLTEDDLSRIEGNLVRLTDASEQIKLAKAAGIPVEQMETEVSQKRQQLLQIKNTYFPGR